MNILYMASGKDLKKALKSIDLSLEQIAEKLDISRGTLYNKFKLAELEEDFVQSVQDSLGIDLNAPALPFIDQRRNTKNSDDPFLVPFVDIPAQAGYKKAYNQRDYIATLKKYPILPDVDPTGAVWRYFQIEGDSMEPEILSGDTILCSQVHIDDWQEIKNYHTHVIVTENELWIKDVYRLSNKEWALLSQNKEYEPFSVNVEEVRQVWVMRRHIKARAKKNHMYNLEDIKKQLKK